MTSKGEKLYSFSAGFLFAAIVFVVFLAGFNFVLAAWIEPTEAPPEGNINPPINTGKNNVFQDMLGGLTINEDLIVGGITTTTWLCFPGSGCQDSWNNITGVWNEGDDGIFYDAGNVAVGPAYTGIVSPFWPSNWARMTISMGNANDREGLYITRDAVFDSFSYFNIENEIGAPIFRVHQSGNVGIGTGDPNSILHIASSTGNAEIDIQSNGDVDGHWGIYHDDTWDELRFWKDDQDRVIFSDDGIITANIMNAYDVDGTNNAEIIIQSVPDTTISEHWAIYHDGDAGNDSRELRFWNDNDDADVTNDNQVTFSEDGVVTANEFCIKDVGCFGGGALTSGVEFVGTTISNYDGNQGGYNGANNFCQTDIATPDVNNHVCTTDEILELINTDNIPPAGTRGWFSNGPPGFTAWANDCGGWTKDGSELGAFWNFDVDGGLGALTSCNPANARPFLCCK
jgi:hypothetical protein